jgi:hypothetical protein
MALAQGGDPIQSDGLGLAREEPTDAMGQLTVTASASSHVLVPGSLARTASVERLGAFFDGLTAPPLGVSREDRGLIATLRSLPGYDPYLDALLVADNGDLLAAALSQTVTARLAYGRRMPAPRRTDGASAQSQRAWVRFLTRRQGDEIADGLGAIAERSTSEMQAVLVEAVGASPGIEESQRTMLLQAIGDEARRQGFGLMIAPTAPPDQSGNITHHSSIVVMPSREMGLVWAHSSAVEAGRWLLRRPALAQHWLSVLIEDIRAAAKGSAEAVRSRSISPLRSTIADILALRARSLAPGVGVAPSDVTLFGTEVQLLTPDDLAYCEKNAEALQALLIASSPAVGVAVMPGVQDLVSRLRVYIELSGSSEREPSVRSRRGSSVSSPSPRWLVALGTLAGSPVALAVARVAGHRAPVLGPSCTIRGLWIAPALPWHERGRVAVKLARMIEGRSGGGSVTAPSPGGPWHRIVNRLTYGRRTISTQSWYITPLVDAREYRGVLERSMSPNLP